MLVEDRARGVERERGGLVAHALAERPDQRAGHAGGLGGDAQRRAQRVRSAPRPARRSAVLAGCSASRRAARAHGAGMSRWSGSVRQHALQQPHRGDAVDEGVVGLGVHRDPAVAQALDDVRLPQRPLPGEPGAVQPRAQLEQLADPARLGQRAVPDVVLDVELLVGPPDQLAGRPGRAVGVLEEQRRDLVDVAHLLVHLADVVAARALGLLEQLQPADVHRHVAVLGEQEPDRRRVDRCDHGVTPSRRSFDPCAGRAATRPHPRTCDELYGVPLPIRAEPGQARYRGQPGLHLGSVHVAAPNPCCPRRRLRPARRTRHRPRRDLLRAARRPRSPTCRSRPSRGPATAATCSRTGSTPTATAAAPATRC